MLTVSDAVIWPAASIPAPGHYCFVGVAGNPLDPKPNPATFANFDQYVTYVENNNNVAWRNFNVVAGPPSRGEPPGFYRLAFLIPGAFDTSRQFELEAIGRLPSGSRAQLELPAWLADALRPYPCEVEYDYKAGIVRIPLHPAGLQRVGKPLLHAGTQAKCRVLVKLPQEKRRRDAGQFAVRQLYKGREVGRLTWHFPTLGGHQA